MSDKSKLDQLAKGLIGLGYELVSTGGSARQIASLGVPVSTVEELTGFPEMLDGMTLSLDISCISELAMPPICIITLGATK